MNKNFIISIKYLLLSTLIFGLLYTFLITGIGHVLFKHKATGSIIRSNGTVLGSALIAQKFSDPKFFWGRPSAGGYETIPSSASNYGATSKDLKKNIDDRFNELKKFYPELTIESTPPELLLASGSGLDPDINPQTAIFQIDRIMKVRALPVDKKETLVDLVKKHTNKKLVNVLELNLDLERLLNGKQL